MGFFKPNVKKMQARNDVEGLLALTADPDLGRAAFEALAAIGEPAIEGLLALTADRERHDAAYEALASIGQPAVKALVTMLSDESRIKAIATALVSIGTTAFDPVVTALDSRDTAVREGALRTLYAFARFRSTGRAYSEIERIAKDDDNSGLRAMAKNMSEELEMLVFERIREVNRVLDGLESADSAVRHEAAACLRRWSYPEVSLLTKMTLHREAAVEDALVLMGPQVIEPIVEAMEGADPDIKKATYKTLMYMKLNGVPWAERAMRQTVEATRVATEAEAEEAPLPVTTVEAGPPSTSQPTLKDLADLGRMVQKLALLNQSANHPSREAATLLAARCSTLATGISEWRASFPEANPSTMTLCNCTVTFAGAIAATLLTPDDLTDSELQQGYRDYQSSRDASNEAVNNWYAYVQQRASSEGVRLTFNLE